MERFVITVNGFQLLTIIPKRSILDAATALGPPLSTFAKFFEIFSLGQYFLKTMMSNFILDVWLGSKYDSVFLKILQASNVMKSISQNL